MSELERVPDEWQARIDELDNERQERDEAEGASSEDAPDIFFAVASCTVLASTGPKSHSRTSKKCTPRFIANPPDFSCDPFHEI